MYFHSPLIPALLSLGRGTVGGTNTGNGNKLTTLPIVGWTARGGLPVNFTIYHNSQGNHNSELGAALDTQL